RTFKELAVRYGEPFVTHLGVEALKPADFSNLVIAQAAVKNILEFQRDRLEEEQPQRGPLRISTSPIRPAALIAPYFYIDESMDWYDTDITLAKEAVNLNLGLPIYAVIAIDRTILQDVSKLTSIADGYCKTKVDGFFIWISDQIEYDLGSQDVCNYIKLIKALCADGRPVYNFYGGFLSAILSAFGLTGFSHGAGYGEHRNVIPVLGGGLPPAKFYIPSLHKGFVFAEAHTILSKVSSASDFYKYVCNCPVCQATIDDDFLANFEKYGETEVKGVDRRGQPVIGQTTDSIKACRAHYLVARFNELVNIRENDIRSVLLELDTALKQYHSPSGFPPISYLHVWENSVSDELDKLS
ncbi:MAG: hypothetical protein NTZ34_02890, partial [Chloroflexi bacterium]|nr:hypothetical protein [Chloroflexota bacterium]